MLLKHLSGVFPQSSNGILWTKSWPPGFGWDHLVLRVCRMHELKGTSQFEASSVQAKETKAAPYRTVKEQKLSEKPVPELFTLYY